MPENKSIRDMKRHEITEDDLWANMEDFLRRVVPVAEKAGVKLAVHPDDPPISPVRNIRGPLDAGPTRHWP